MNKLLNFFYWIIFFGNSNKIAKKIGVKIGEDCRILGNPYRLFGSEPYLINIGNHVSISSGTTFITHYGEYWVLRQNHKYDKFNRISIGNNVFIGQNCIIFPGVHIGDNVVVGAGSIVKHDVASNSIVAGNPAKFIMTFEEFKNKKMEQKTIVLNKGNRKKQILDFLGKENNEFI